MVFDPPLGLPLGGPMPFRLQHITLLHLINMHAKFQLPIIITGDFIIQGYFGPILDPFGTCILSALRGSVGTFWAKNLSDILSVTGQLNTLYQISTVP